MRKGEPELCAAPPTGNFTPCLPITSLKTQSPPVHCLPRIPPLVLAIRRASSCRIQDCQIYRIIAVCAYPSESQGEPPWRDLPSRFY